MRPIRVSLLVGLVLVAALLVASSANAKVGGANGRIAFSRDDGTGNTVVYTANPDGSHMSAALLAGFSPESPHWSPDGSLLAVNACMDPPTCDTAETIINPDTGAFRAFSSPNPNLFVACVVWTPSATRLACEGNGNTDPTLNGIYTIRVSDGRGLSRVTSDPGGDDIPIDYAPSGRQLVFSRSDPSGPRGKNCALFTVTIATGAVARITPWGFCDDDGSWSPDGAKIIFEHFGSLYTVHPDGSHLVKIALQTGSATTSFSAFDAAWSPSGTRIVFALRTKTSAGQTQEGIATANADGSDLRVVTTSPTRDGKPDWGSHPLK